MISSHDFRFLTDEDKSRYKFCFCEDCEFYECELVREYFQFKENHYGISIPSIPAKPVRVVDAPAVPVSPFGLVSVAAASVADSDSDKHSATIKVEAAKTDSYINFINEDKSYIGSLSYDQEELKNDCIMSERYVNQVECGRNNVTDGIGDHFKIDTSPDFGIETDTNERWESAQPVFISAQTGQGKNYFVENTLIPYVKNLNNRKKTNQRVLILSNRLALKHQIKNRIKGNSDLDNEKWEIYPYKEFADIMTYQSLLDQIKHLEKAQKNGVSRYIYVICDEAHFFTSDAMFNPHTQKILSAIVRIFKDAIRVYMSATPYECLEYISKYETEYKSQYEYHPIAFYHFKRDYSYLNTMSYSRINELYNHIVTSIADHGEKWLIFIDDIEKCKIVKEELEEYGRIKGIPMISEDEDSKISKIFTVDATSKKDKDYESMVLNEKLNSDTYVLISTSVLDNGVNLTGIHNIVVSDMSKVKCLQMVGRARVKGAYDPKTLYIRRFNEEYVNKRINNFEEQEDAYHRYDMAYDGPYNVDFRKGYSEYYFLDKYYNGDFKDWQNAKHWFGRPMEKPTELYLNDIAHSQLKKLIPQYKFILDEIIEEREMQEATDVGNKNIIGQRYLEHQLSWFGKKYYADNDVTIADTMKAKNALMDFLESYVEKRIYSDKDNKNKEQNEFRKKFTQLHDSAFGKLGPNKRDYGLTLINETLKKNSIDFRIESLREKKKGYWIVIPNKDKEVLEEYGDTNDDTEKALNQESEIANVQIDVEQEQDTAAAADIENVAEQQPKQKDTINALPNVKMGQELKAMVLESHKNGYSPKKYKQRPTR